MNEERPRHPPLRLVVLKPLSTPVTKPRATNSALFVGALLLGAGLGVAVAGALLEPAHRLGAKSEHIPAAFDSLGSRPAAASGDTRSSPPLTFLLVGSDSPAPRLANGWPGGRGDAIMLARLCADRRHAQVISIPRDAWVPVPGYGHAKISTAYARGGPRLLVKSVERLTGTHIDHFAAVDFAGLASIVDSLGGVTVAVAESTSAGGALFVAGDNDLDGGRAVLYARQRLGLAQDDLDRVHRHQQLLRELLSRLEAGGLLRALAAGEQQLRGLTHAVQLDEGLTALELARIAFEARALETANVEFLTVPSLGFGHEGGETVLYLNEPRSSLLWRYLRGDSLAGQLPEFAAERLPGQPR